MSPDLLLLKACLDRMPLLISDEVKKQGYSSGGQANALVWVLSLGPTWLGWCALQVLFEVVELHNERAAETFFLCCNGDGQMPRYFAKVSEGRSSTMAQFTRHLRISFDISPYMEDTGLLRTNLTHSIHRLTSLRSLTFDIREWNDSNAFILMTRPGLQYPASLHTVRMLSISTDFSKQSAVSMPVFFRSLPWTRSCWKDRLARFGHAKQLIMVFRHTVSLLHSAEESGYIDIISTANPPDPGDSFIDGILNSPFQHIILFEDIPEYSIDEDFRVFCYEGCRWDLKMKPGGIWSWSENQLPPPPADSEDRLWNRSRTRSYFHL